MVLNLSAKLAFALGSRTGEALVRHAHDQQRLSLQRLLELELVAVVPAVELEAPPPWILELLTARRLRHAVQRHELGNDQLAHRGLLCLTAL
jgi:hypothetical protein